MTIIREEKEEKKEEEIKSPVRSIEEGAGAEFLNL